MDRGAWWATAYGVPKSRIGLSDCHFTLTSRLVSWEEEFSKQDWSHGMCHEGQTGTTLGSKA